MVRNPLPLTFEGQEIPRTTILIRQLAVRVLIGQPEGAGDAPRQGLHRPVKFCPVSALRQGGQQLVICGRGAITG